MFNGLRLNITFQTGSTFYREKEFHLCIVFEYVFYSIAYMYYSSGINDFILWGHCEEI